jgi:hypothetical protein
MGIAMAKSGKSLYISYLTPEGSLVWTTMPMAPQSPIVPFSPWLHQFLSPLKPMKKNHLFLSFTIIKAYHPNI